jgi:hypothetical protein
LPVGRLFLYLLHGRTPPTEGKRRWACLARALSL